MESLHEMRCTTEAPWSLDKRDGAFRHVDARLLFSDYHSSTFECPNCGGQYEVIRDEEPSTSPHWKG